MTGCSVSTAELGERLGEFRRLDAAPDMRGIASL